MLSPADVLGLFEKNRLTLDDVKNAMMSARHHPIGVDVEYANNLLPEAGDYLPRHLVRALIRADLSEEDAGPFIEQNKQFFVRLAALLPELVRYFRPPDPKNIFGILCCIDDCHNDYNVSANSLRKDRMFREVRHSLESAHAALTTAIEALEKSERYLDLDYERYYALYFQPSRSSRTPRQIRDLIEDIKVCSGVVNIVKASAALDENYLFLSGNDKRTTLVDYAYTMSLMWNGPKLVTTPGSEFSTLCSLLFEAVSGIADESLAGAINRYARSAERKKHDNEDLELKSEEENEDNFLAERREMRMSAKQIEHCKKLLVLEGLPDTARTLLLLKIQQETKEYEAARDRYGPRQVYLDHLNDEQIQSLSTPRFDSHALSEFDKAVGDARRALRGKALDM